MTWDSTDTKLFFDSAQKRCKAKTISRWGEGQGGEMGEREYRGGEGWETGEGKEFT